MGGELGEGEGELGVCTWTFHCDRCSRGIASFGAWAVTEVNCSKASRWDWDSWAMSGVLEGSDMTDLEGSEGTGGDGELLDLSAGER